MYSVIRTVCAGPSTEQQLEGSTLVVEWAPRVPMSIMRRPMRMISSIISSKVSHNTGDLQQVYVSFFSIRNRFGCSKPSVVAVEDFTHRGLC